METCYWNWVLTFKLHWYMKFDGATIQMRPLIILLRGIIYYVCCKDMLQLLSLWTKSYAMTIQRKRVQQQILVIAFDFYHFSKIWFIFFHLSFSLNKKVKVVFWIKRFVNKSQKLFVPWFVENVYRNTDLYTTNSWKKQTII